MAPDDHTDDETGTKANFILSHATGAVETFPVETAYSRPVSLSEVLSGQIRVESGGYTPSSRELEAYRKDMRLVVYEFLQNQSYGLGFKPPPIVLLVARDGSRVPYTGDDVAFPHEKDIYQVQFITASPRGITTSQACLNLRDEKKQGLGHWARGLKFAAVTLLTDHPNCGIEICSTYKHAKTGERVDWVGQYAMDDTTDGSSSQLNLHWATAPSEVKQTVFTVKQPPVEFIRALKESRRNFLFMNPEYRGGVLVPGDGDKNGGVVAVFTAGGMTAELLDDKVVPDFVFPAGCGFVDGTVFQTYYDQDTLLFPWHLAGGLEKDVASWAKISRSADSNRADGLEPALARLIRVGLNTGALGVSFWERFFDRLYESGYTEDVTTAVRTGKRPSRPYELADMGYIFSSVENIASLSTIGCATLREAWLSFCAKHPDVSCFTKDFGIDYYRKQLEKVKLLNGSKTLVCYSLAEMLRQIGGEGDGRPLEISEFTDNTISRVAEAMQPTEVFSLTPFGQVEIAENVLTVEQAVYQLAERDGVGISSDSTQFTLSEDVGLVYIAGHPENILPKDPIALTAIAVLVEVITARGGQVYGTFHEVGSEVATFKLLTQRDGNLLEILATGDVRDSLKRRTSSRLVLGVRPSGDDTNLIKRLAKAFNEGREAYRKKMAGMNPEERHKKEVAQAEAKTKAREDELAALKGQMEERVQAEIDKRVNAEIARREAEIKARVKAKNQELARHDRELQVRLDEHKKKMAALEAEEAEKRQQIEQARLQAEKALEEKKRQEEMERLERLQREQFELESKQRALEVEARANQEKARQIAEEKAKVEAEKTIVQAEVAKVETINIQLVEKQKKLEQAEERLRLAKEIFADMRRNVVRKVLRTGLQATGSGAAVWGTMEYGIPWLINQDWARTGAVTLRGAMVGLADAAGIPTLLGRFGEVVRIDTSQGSPRVRMYWPGRGTLIDSGDVSYMPPGEVSRLADLRVGETRPAVMKKPSDQEIGHFQDGSLVVLEGSETSVDTGGFFYVSLNDTFRMLGDGYLEGSDSQVRGPFRSVNLPKGRPEKYAIRERYLVTMPVVSWAPLAMRLGEAPVAFAGVNAAKFRQNSRSGAWEVNITGDPDKLIIYTDIAQEGDLAYLKVKPIKESLEPLLDINTLRPDVQEAISLVKKSNMTESQKIDEVLTIWRRLFVYDKGRDVKNDFPRKNMQVFISAMISQGLGTCGYAAVGAAALLRAAGIPADVCTGFSNESFGTGLAVDELHATIRVWDSDHNQWSHIEPQSGRASTRMFADASGLGDNLDRFGRIDAGNLVINDGDGGSSEIAIVRPVDLGWSMTGLVDNGSIAVGVKQTDEVVVTELPDGIGTLEARRRFARLIEVTQVIAPYVAAGTGAVFAKEIIDQAVRFGRVIREV